MLKRALLYKDTLTAKFIDIWDNPEYKYIFDSYRYVPELKDDSWDCDEFVSVNDEGEVVGFIRFYLNQQVHGVDNILMASLSTELADRTLLLMDLQKAIHDYFWRFNYSRIEFSVHIGNKVENFYDKFVAACGGKVCGYTTASVMALDGELLDVKRYEILREQYLKHVPADDYKVLIIDNKQLEQTF